MLTIDAKEKKWIRLVNIGIWSYIFRDKLKADLVLVKTNKLDLRSPELIQMYVATYSIMTNNL